MTNPDTTPDIPVTPQNTPDIPVTPQTDSAPADVVQTEVTRNQHMAVPQNNLWLQSFPDAGKILLSIVKSEAVPALAKGQGNSAYWIVIVALSVFCSSLIMGLQTAYGFGAVASWIPYGERLGVSDYVSSTAFSAFFIVLISALIVIFARITALWLVFKVRGEAIAYTTAASIASVAFTPLLFVIILVTLLSLFPVFAFWTLAMLMATVFIPMCSFIAELIIYIGLNRTVEFKKSPLMPHVLLTGAAGVVSGIAALAFFSILG